MAQMICRPPQNGQLIDIFGSGSVSKMIFLLVGFVPIIGHGKIKAQETSEAQSASGRKPERAPRS
jgi:hypothetical protein